MLYLIFFIIQLITCCLVQGFCIYNKTPNYQYFIHQEPLNAGGNYLSRFKRDKLEAGDQACCPYTDYDCNKTGDRNSVLLMTFKSFFYGKDKEMFTLNCPAGGWVEFLPNGHGEPIIKVYEKDGTPFNYDYQTNVNEMLLY